MFLIAITHMRNSSAYVFFDTTWSMTKIFISEPLWTYKGRYGSPSVGIAPHKIKDEETLEVEVLTKQHDQRLYEGKFFMSGSNARGYPKVDFRCGEMIVIPLDEFNYEPMEIKKDGK